MNSNANSKVDYENFDNEKEIDLHMLEISKEISNSLDDFSRTITFSKEKENEQKLEKVLKIQNFIQRCFKRRELNKKMKRKIKDLKYRANVVKEIICTEDSFIKNLDIIIQNIIFPLKLNQKLHLSQSSLRTILSVFSNIESIRNFNEKLFLQLKHLKTNYHHLITFGRIVLGFLPFFKFYFVYCNEFEEHNLLLQKIKNDTENLDFKQFTNWLKTIENTPTLKNMDLISFIVMPVQRLPKYILLFKDLLKHTEESHPDYNDLQKCLKKFIEINEENNKGMQTYLKNMKLFELQSTFGNKDLIILDSKREFVAEEALGLIMKNNGRSVICYFLSDLILVTERSVENSNVYKLSYLLLLNDESFLKDLPNTKYFSHLFSVTGSNISLTFSAGDAESKKRYVVMISNILDKLYEKNENKVNLFKKFAVTSRNFGTQQIFNRLSERKTINLKVNAFGTEERDYNTFGRYTVYIMEIAFKDFNRKIYVRYSEMIELYKLVKKHYKNIDIPKIANNHWFNHRKTRIIESRKILIENFLQILLRNEDIVKDGKEVLSFLNLPIDLYQNEPKNEVVSNCSLISFEVENTDGDSMVEKGFTMDDLRFTTPKRSKLDANPPQNLSYILKPSSALMQSIKRRRSKIVSPTKSSNINLKNLKVFLSDETTIKVKVSLHSSSEDIVEQIANKIGLQNWDDFRLFLYDGGAVKLIDDDEIVLKYFYDLKKMQKNESKTKENKNPEKEFDLDKKIKSKILFRKYLYLSPEMEKQDYFNDLVRVRLLAYQIFQDLDLYKNRLEKSEYLSSISLYLYIKFGDYNIYKTNPIFLKMMSDLYLPKQILNFKKSSPQMFEKIPETWERLSKDIEEISIKKYGKICKMKKQRRNSYEEKRIPFNSEKEKDCKYKECEDKIAKNTENNLKEYRMLIACYSVIHLFEKLDFYGSNIYWVENYDHIKKGLQKYAFLAVKFDRINLLKAEDKIVLKSWSYDQILDSNSQPKSLILKFHENDENVTYRFNTFRGLEINSIIQDYKKLRKLLEI